RLVGGRRVLVDRLGLGEGFHDDDVHARRSCLELWSREWVNGRVAPPHVGSPGRRQEHGGSAGVCQTSRASGRGGGPPPKGEANPRFIGISRGRAVFHAFLLDSLGGALPDPRGEALAPPSARPPPALASRAPPAPAGGAPPHLRGSGPSPAARRARHP